MNKKKHRAKNAARSNVHYGAIVGHRYWTDSSSPISDWDTKDEPGYSYQYFANGKQAYSVLRKDEADRLRNNVRNGGKLGLPYIFHFSDDWDSHFSDILTRDGFVVENVNDWLAIAIGHLVSARNPMIAMLIVAKNMFDGVTCDTLRAFGRDSLYGGIANPHYEMWELIIGQAETVVFKSSLEVSLKGKSDAIAKVKI